MRRKNGSKIETLLVLNTYTTLTLSTTVVLFPDYQRVDTKGYE